MSKLATAMTEVISINVPIVVEKGPLFLIYRNLDHKSNDKIIQNRKMSTAEKYKI